MPCLLLCDVRMLCVPPRDVRMLCVLLFSVRMLCVPLCNVIMLCLLLCDVRILCVLLCDVCGDKVRSPTPNIANGRSPTRHDTNEIVLNNRHIKHSKWRNNK